MAAQLLVERAITFKGIDFTRYVVSFQDDRQPTIAMHEFIKRDGGEAESMGRKPHKVKFNCAFLGTNGFAKFKELQASIDKDPKGQLVHPIYGTMRVCAQGHSGSSMDLEHSPNLYTVALEFIGDEVDTRIQATTAADAAAREQEVRTLNTSMLTAVSYFTSAATATANLSTAALSFATAAYDAVSATTPDPSLPAKLETCRETAASARAAILSSTSSSTASTDGAKFTAIMSVERLYDACTRLDDAVRTVKPKLTTYIVPATIPLLTLACQFYKQDGAARVDEIRLNNPGKIPNPAAVAAGTELLMATPTTEG